MVNNSFSYCDIRRFWLNYLLTGLFIAYLHLIIYIHQRVNYFL